MQSQRYMLPQISLSTSQFLLMFLSHSFKFSYPKKHYGTKGVGGQNREVGEDKGQESGVGKIIENFEEKQRTFPEIKFLLSLAVRLKE